MHLSLAKHLTAEIKIGMSAAQLTHEPAQMSLFVDPVHERQKKVDALADQITAKFGTKAIRRGGGLS